MHRRNPPSTRPARSRRREYQERPGWLRDPACLARVVRAVRAVRELWLDLLALLWPTVCVGCGRRDRELCAACRETVLDRVGDTPLLEIDGLGVPGVAASSYDGPVRGALLAYKHRGAYGFVRPLGKRLTRALWSAAQHPAGENRVRAPTRDDPAPAARDPAPTWVVPMPSRPRRVRERGWRHVDDLVRVAIHHGQLPLKLCPVLRALPGRTGQVGLDTEARERNARRVAVRRTHARDVAGRRVLIVDDIVTTGASARAAIATLERAGAHVIAVVTLCLTTRRDAPQKTEWNLTGEKG